MQTTNATITRPLFSLVTDTIHVGRTFYSATISAREVGHAYSALSVLFGDGFYLRRYQVEFENYDIIVGGVKIGNADIVDGEIRFMISYTATENAFLDQLPFSQESANLYRVLSYLDKVKRGPRMNNQPKMMVRNPITHSSEARIEALTGLMHSASL